MATQKGLCPYCQGKRFERRVFQVNPEAKTCFCPTCMKEMAPKLAIDGYNDHIKKLLEIADNTLFVTCDPVLAYQQYADVIELEPKEPHALLGRITCLVYMGKVRKTYLNEATTLLENTSYEGVDLDEYSFFLKKINFALDEYDEELKKKLTFKEFFYDLDCLKLYWSHLYEIIKMKQFVLSILKEIKKIHESHQTEVIINMLDHSIDEKDKILHLDTFTADGKSYAYERIYNGRVFVKMGKSEMETKLSRYRLSTLDETDKTKKYIDDEVFRDYTKIVTSKKVSLVISVLLYILMGGFIAAGIILKEDLMFFVPFMLSAGVLFGGATALLVLHLYWRLIIKKRKLRID